MVFFGMWFPTFAFLYCEGVCILYVLGLGIPG